MAPLITGQSGPAQKNIDDYQSGAGSYNNAAFLYNLVNSKCYAKIDRVTISILNKYGVESEHNIRSKLFKEFTPGYYTIKDTWTSDNKAKVKKNSYRRIRTIKPKNADTTLAILYERNYIPLPCFCLQVDDPDHSIVDVLLSVQRKLSFDYSLSQMELAFDFFPYKYDFHQFLHKHLYLNYYRGHSTLSGRGVLKSNYVGHRGKNAKSVIMYRKMIKGQSALRLELRINRQSLKTLKLEFSSLDITNIDLRRVMNLKDLNWEKFINYIRRKYKRYRSSPRGKLRLRTALSALFYEGEPPSVMDTKYLIKNSRYHHHNYTKLFDNIEEINDLFHKKLSESINRMSPHDSMMEDSQSPNKA